jgi:hypothetical protein
VVSVTGPYGRILGFLDRPSIFQLKTKLNSVVIVREPTISTERPPLVDEVTANLRIEDVAWPARRIAKAVFSDF